MKILLVKPEGESLKKYTDRLDTYGIQYEEMSYPVTSAGLVDHTFNEAFTEKMYQIHKETVDAIQFFSREWTNPPNKKILGRMFNRFFSTYLISYTKLRRGYEDTAIHELMHKADNWTYVYLGKKLEDIVGVKDWDDCVVHAEDRRFTEYEYEEIWKVVRPHVLEALAYKKHKALLGYMQLLLVRLREMIRNLQDMIIEMEDTDHPVEGYSVSYKYGVPDAAYALTGHHIGTDYFTPKGTPVKAPIAGEVTVAGNSRSLGNYCHFKYSIANKTYTARFLHLQTVPTRGKYQKGQIIAYSGNTGFTSGPHLHIDVWKDDVRLDLINTTNWQQMTLDPEEHFAG